MTTVHIPWRAWYGDDLLELTFPSSWQVKDYWPSDAPDIGREGIERAFDNPLGTLPLEELARGKRWVSIAVDDISRPTPAARLMPPLLHRLEKAGIDPDRVRVVLAIGLHRQMVKEDIIKKIGQAAADRLDVHNHHPYDNLVDLGTSARGTPVHICRYFAEADLKIGVGTITPHGAAGFGGGAKTVIPGVAGYETIASFHAPGRLKTGLGLDCPELRDEVEQMVRHNVGLDAIINVVPNSRRQIAGCFVGDMVAAQRAGVRLARQVYATAIPEEPVDIAICNAYPKDTDFVQHSMATNILGSSPRRLVKDGGTVIIITASPEGRGHHALYGPGMRYDPLRVEKATSPKTHGAQLVFFAPGVTAADARTTALFRRWEDLVQHLVERYGNGASVAVFPCGAIQLAK